MICLKCENDKFSEKSVRLDQEFKGKSIQVLANAMVCNSCGFIILNDEQANTLRKITADTFKENNKLLTSTQIKEYREKLQMSQAQFASYLGVGSASIKRWETFFIQDKSQDDLIRIKCDSSFAEMNALEVRWALDQPDVFNGFKKFDLEVCKHVLTKIIEVAPSPLYFFKAIFYIDFVHFKRFGRGVTGMKYSSLPYGPIPKDYDHLLNYLIQKDWLVKDGKHDLKSHVKFDQSIFSTDEIATINEVYEVVKAEGKKYLFDKSHEEEAFKQCGYLESLNYEDAKKLEIF